ncbi:hypothetical protein OESDEN_24485 [Oesophagostomum dentatum]|uniref:Uncharacterized protein n=1 Tax=Oesophagostomum dentatum TaxID=61180 RepID=A0A0B1RXF6_OESDE|nr:hypothetical protein OESDEN_24485 [Oesophagostomum dentatum]
MVLDPEQIMKELEQYDVQDSRGATFDPDVYDSVLEEFSRFVRDGRGSGQQDENFVKYDANQNVPPPVKIQQQYGTKATNSRDVTQRGQQTKERGSLLSIFN